MEINKFKYITGTSPAPSTKKKAAPPRPPAPKKGGTSPSMPRANNDAFGGMDPFAASSGNTGGDSFGGFADFSPTKV